MNSAIRKYRTIATLSGLAAALLFAVPASAQTKVNSCGQTLGQPGQYVLTADLNCSGTFASGIEVTASNVVFHLAGHTIASTDCDRSKEINGIFVHGGISGVRIDGGTVRGFNDGIVLSSSQSRVRGMTVTNACVFGIAVQGHDNVVRTSVVTLSGLDGVGLLHANDTLIASNDISGNVRLGVDIAGDSNRNLVKNNIINRNGIVAGEQGGVAIFGGSDNVVANNALNNNFSGIHIDSPLNVARGNTVSGSLDVGIFIDDDGSPSIVRYNTVFGSVLVDMEDLHASCDANTWNGNAFQTDLVAGSSDGGPKSGCIR